MISVTLFLLVSVATASGQSNSTEELIEVIRSTTYSATDTPDSVTTVVEDTSPLTPHNLTTSTGNNSTVHGSTFSDTVDSSDKSFIDKIIFAARNTNYQVQKVMKDASRKLKNFFNKSNKQANATQPTEQSNFTSTLE